MTSDYDRIVQADWPYKRPWIAYPISIFLNILFSPIWIAILSMAAWEWAMEKKAKTEDKD